MSLAQTKNTKEYAEKLNETVNYIKEQWGNDLPDVAIVLGSGLGQFAQRYESCLTIPYSDIPNMVKTTVSGHSGNLVLGTLANGKKVITFAGRVHAYEGIRMFEVTYLARIAHGLGAKIFIATNAAGGALDEMNPGDAMIITDHVNILKRHPLQEVFADASVCPPVSGTRIYSKRIAGLAREIAAGVTDFGLREGTYACCPGPSYETPSEVRGGKDTGIGAFGMSTVPECIVASSLGLEVFALSLCTNLAAGISSIPLSHEEVKEVADNSGPLLMTFMERLLSNLDADPETIPAVLPPPTGDGVTLNRNVNRATAEEINVASEFVQQKFSAKFSIAVQLTAKFSSVFVDSQFATETVSFDVSEIPNYPCISNLGGKVVLGKNNSGAGVLCLVPNSEIGFLPAEACFLVQLMKKLGVSFFFFGAVGATVTETSDYIFGIDDACDITTMHCSTLPHADEFLTSVKAFNSKYEILDNCKCSFVPYFQFTGPTFPTPSEQAFAALSKYTVVGITNVQIAFAARAAGLNVAGMVAKIYSLPDFTETNAQQGYSRLNTLLSICVKACDPPTLETTDVSTVSSVHQLGYELRNTRQGDPKVISPMISSLREFGAKMALIVYDPFFEHISGQISDIVAVDLGGATDFCPIYFGVWQNKKILLVHQNRYYHQGFDFAEVFSSIRAVSGAGVEKVAIVSGFCSVSEAVKVGEIVTIKDHVNVTGRSPLFGEQIEGWGRRFPDMSSVWNSNISEEIEGETVKKEIVGTIIGPMFHSELEASYIRTVSATIVSTSVGWDALVIKHMCPSVDLIGVGLVTANAMELKKSDKSSKLSLVCQLVQQFFSQ
mmetsp:Transcript_131382/g.195714  ORF Transcript_131382/g.195714 Transcript_131382/m.195714 type:complete len:835 (+) Transcript_131382:17-2521(+)